MKEMLVVNPPLLDGLLPQLVALRHAIHRRPDLSGQEAATAKRLFDFLAPFEPDRVVEGLGGCGLAVVFAGNRPGPTTVFTSELDAVPIADQGMGSHRSQVPGVGHLCGHDGHMVAAVGIGALLASRRSFKGRVVLLFRPQEETGRGAPAVVSDPRLVAMNPRYIFGFHTMPGYPLGAVLYRQGLFAWAATDFVVELLGKSAHGGQPGAGRSPAMALSQIMERFDNLSAWFDLDLQGHASQAAYARLGESDHGTTPGSARMRATLRSRSDDGLQRLCDQADRMVAEIARKAGLQCKRWSENWIPATRNHRQAMELVLTSAREARLPAIELDDAQRWSDDFGVLTRHFPGAFFGLGGGDACGQLHGPDFDFPDELLAPALRLYTALVARINGA